MDNISSFDFEDFDPFALPFVMAANKSQLPTLPGIYFAIGGARTILYIGSARNIRARWKNHHVYIFLIMAMVDARIAWMTAQNAGRLHIFEEELVKHFKPPLNVTWNNKHGRLDVLDALDRLNKMDELYSKEATVDRVSTAYLLKRYNLNSRTALINRLSALEIKPVREGNRFFVSIDEMDKLDALNQCLQQGNSLTECAIEVKTGLLFKSNEIRLHDGNLPPLLELPSLKRDPFEDYRQLDEIAKEGWYISTSELLQILKLKTIPPLDDHNRFTRMGFVFWKVGKVGREYEWRITKVQP